MFRHFSRLSAYQAIVAAAAALTLTVPASASQPVQRFSQAEQRDAYGRLAVEASIITVVNCNGAGENGRQYYIYSYTNRPGVRAILPPYWSQAVGGRDWATYEQAVSAACGGGAVYGGGGSSANLTGNWKLTTSCGFTNPNWSADVYLSQGGGGALSASFTNDKLNASEVAPSGPNSWGTNMKSQVSGSTFNLVMHPNGWVSVLEFTGTVNGNRIDGRIHHYTNDDCNFTMVR